MGGAQRRRMVGLPDLDDELTTAIDVIEQVLLTLRCWENEPESPALPPPLAGGAARAALNRVYDKVSPTQGAAGPRPLGPDGRYEHIPLRFVDLAAADVQTLAGAARAFGDPYRSDDVTTALEVIAAALPDPERGTGSVVAVTARLVGLLDLAWTGDVTVLHTLIGAAATEDVVLTAGEEAAYQTTVIRLNATWALGDVLARFTTDSAPASAPRPGRLRPTTPASGVPARRRPPSWGTAAPGVQAGTTGARYGVTGVAGL